MSAAEILRELVDGLGRAGIPFMVVGSLASALHGEPRSTQDIDLVIDPDEAALRRWVDTLDRDRWYVGGVDDALAARDQFNLIDLRLGWKVDLVIRKDRPFSRSEFSRRQQQEILGVEVFVAAPEDVVLAKLEWAAAGGSDRQVRDAIGVVAVSGPGLDRGYLRRWAGELGVDGLLRDVLARGNSS